jgi:8-oxo-dGTP pyrophosphatase MutT (NUDIX family)
MYPSAELRERLLRTLDAPGPLDPAALPPDTVPAAVLAPFLGATAQPRLVFTRRTDSLRRHAGEISFPGGLVDAGEHPAAAALREAEEELGLKPAHVELLGALPPVHTRVTGILILPFVGWLKTDPSFTPSAAEIAEVLEFPVADLLARASTAEFEYDGRRFETDVFDMGGAVIWGATARVVRSLVDLIEPDDGRGRSAAHREASGGAR